MLLASLVLRVMTISSGVTRRNAASVLRRFSFSPLNRARFCADGSWSTLSLSRFSASSTGRDAGQRLAALSTPRSGGITNCSRTDFQKASPVPPMAGDECLRLAVFAGPDRIGEQRRGATDGEESGEIATGN